MTIRFPTAAPPATAWPPCADVRGLGLGPPATGQTDRVDPARSDALAGLLRAGPNAAGRPVGTSRPGVAGVPLIATARAAAAIAAGDHQVRVVDGRTLRYPSQDLAQIESLRPDQPGQSHALARHVGTTLADNIARLEGAPLLRAAGSYDSAADAQFATDHTIANPRNQREIADFLADPGRLRVALGRVDLGRTVGASTLRSDLLAGTPALVPGTTATVVLIKDPSFPEGYRVLTTYPDTRRPEVDARGTLLP